MSSTGFSKKAFAWSKGKEEPKAGNQGRRGPREEVPQPAGNGFFHQAAGNQKLPQQQQQRQQQQQQQQRQTPSSAEPPVARPRAFQVLEQTNTARAEPHLKGKLKSKRSKGGRVLCSEVTVNGWLKLINNDGWILANNWGMDGLNGLMEPVNDTGVGNTSSSINLAVPHYHPQGMCCLEVIFRTGVPVRQAPEHEAPVISMRWFGEYVFASVQNFDGWIQLAGEDGWMLSYAPACGDLLQQRSPAQVKHVDVAALCDLWTAAHRTWDNGINSEQLKALKEVESRTMSKAEELYDKHSAAESLQELVDDGTLRPQDLAESEFWIRQRLFAALLREVAGESEVLREVLPTLNFTPRVPPLPTDESLETGAEHEWFAFGSHLHSAADAEGSGGVAAGVGNLQPFEYDGQEFMISETGVLYQPPNEVPIGLWNERAARIEPVRAVVAGEDGSPVAVLSFWGRTFLMDAEQRLFDAMTSELVGVFNPETMEIQPFQPEQEEQHIELSVTGEAKPQQRSGLGEDANMFELLERAREKATLGRYKTATLLYERALRVCEQMSAVDLEVEGEILRGRARCWKELGCPKELLADAERLLSIDNSDQEALDLKKLASAGPAALKLATADKGGQ